MINDAATIESRDETTGITIYALDGLRLYGNLHMGIAEQMLNEPVEKSNAAFLIKILKNGSDIVNDVWEQDIEKIKSAHATCEDMCASLTEWGTLLEAHKNQLQCDNYVPQWWVEINDELSWLFIKRFKTFCLICRK